MKKLLIIAILLFFINSVKSQNNKFHFEAGPTIGISVWNSGLGSALGLGIEGTVSYIKSEHISFFGQTGYDVFSGKWNNQDSRTITTHLPIMIGIRYNKNNYIAGFGVGCGIYNFEHGYTETGVAFSPQIGYSFKKFNLLVKYSGTYNGTLVGGQYTDYVGISGVYKI